MYDTYLLNNGDNYIVVGESMPLGVTELTPPLRQKLESAWCVLSHTRYRRVMPVLLNIIYSPMRVTKERQTNK